MKPAVKYYLLAYNGIAFLAWLCYAILLFFRGGDRALIFLTIAQGLAIVEIAHAILGWVRSPIGSTVAQVASRILVLVMLHLFLWDESEYIAWVGLLIVSVAWTVTELVRYSFYFTALLGRQPGWLLTMRYSFFIILYPLGVTGEWFVILGPLITYSIYGYFHVGIGVRVWLVNSFYYAVFTAFLAICYLYYFPILYRYMWKQRRAKL